FSIALDASGNVYTTGYFQGTVDFDPGAAMANLTVAGSFDMFVSKLDGDGNFVWAKSMGGSIVTHGRSIAVDASGNVYTTGSFHGTADFDPGAATAYLTSAGHGDTFICKLDASGNFVWAKSMGGSVFDSGFSITVDASGNVYTIGLFFGTVDFNPGLATADLTSAGFNDIFVSKLDAFGNFIWAKRMGGSGYDYGESIAVDASGHVYTTGYFEGTADFDPGTATANLTSVSVWDIFVSKLGPACNPPTAYGVTGGGAYCAGGTGVVVGLAGSESSVSYQLKRDGSDVGSPVAGTGSALSFGSFTTVGTYTVVATSGAGGCTTVMTGSVAVAVNPLPAVSANGGGTLYLGYGPACTVLTATAIGGSGSYTYQWSGSNGSQSTISVCPETTTAYTVTATDGNGCVSAPAEVSVTVIDVRCGNKNDKVIVCHNGKELCISANAVATHLAHGDQLGSCGSQNPAARLGAEELSVQPPQLSLKAYPNPVQDAVTVEVLSRVAGMASFEVLDVTGRAQQSRKQELVEGWNEVKFRLGTLSTGIYLIRGVDALGQQGVVRVSKEQ
ncbi:MAG: SBBP repeat-containing protein, partial [Bacteroidetes bacterium]|nr:SBBP repeat-containing protein [Bacteroidota bacterium]